MDSKRIIHLVSRTRDRIQKIFQAEIDRLDLGNIAPAHGSVFYALSSGPMTMQELARLIERDTSTVTALADKLEKLGYVRRDVAPDDSRSYIIRLTTKGMRAAPRIVAASQKVVSRLYAGFSETDRETLMQLLGRVYSNAAE